MKKNLNELFKILSCMLFSIMISLGISQLAETAQAGEVAINATTFPDESFREYVLSNCDTDKNKVLSDNEIKSATELNVQRKSITNLKGIENFTALTTLDCGVNQLTSLDLSNNTALKILYCNSNQLTALDLSNNTALDWLDCNNNQLTFLDLSNLTALRGLFCEYNPLTSLDLSNNTALTSLNCSKNQLTSLDLSNHTALDSLTCGYNQLTSLDLSNNTALRGLNCYGNQLTSLDLSNHTALKSLNCHDNPLTALNLNKQVYHTLLLDIENLHFIIVYDSYITRIYNLSNATEQDGLITVTDITKPATYQYYYTNNKTTKLIDFTILYVDPDSSPTKTSKITYVLDGGINSPDNPATYVEDSDKKYDLQNAVKTGYTFNGWYLDAEFTKRVTFIDGSWTGDITLYAKFTKDFVDAHCERLFSDYEYKNPISGNDIVLYGNAAKPAKGTTSTIQKDITIYTDILGSYQYSITNNGKIKASTGKVIAGITMSDTKPVLTKGKIVDRDAANIAKAKIKHGQITVTAVGKARGIVYLWVMDTGNKGTAECCPIHVKLAPKKLEVQELTGSKASKLNIANGNSVKIQVAGFASNIKTEDCIYTASVDPKSQSYVTVEPITFNDANGNPMQNVFSIKGIGLKNNKKTNVSLIFICAESRKKIKFTAEITP